MAIRPAIEIVGFLVRYFVIAYGGEYAGSWEEPRAVFNSKIEAERYKKHMENDLKIELQEEGYDYLYDFDILGYKIEESILYQTKRRR